MIRELMYELYSDQRLIIGSGAFLILYIASVLLLSCDPERKREDIPLILAPLVCASSAVSRIPELIGRKITKPSVRIAALLFALCLTVLAVTSSGTLIFSQELSSPSENSMHIPNDILSAADAVLSDGRGGTVLTMPGWDVYFSCYSSRFDLPCRTKEEVSSITDEDTRLVYTELSQKSPDMKTVARIAHKKGCKYVVLSNDLWPDEPLTKFNYEQVKVFGTCTVYREVTAP